MLVEPQCCGFEHATFNAALLHTVLLAYPDTCVSFMGETEHLEWVRSDLVRIAGVDAHRVEWREILIPARKRGGWKRLGSELRWCRRVLRQASKDGANCLVLCSITDTGLLALKALMHLQGTSVPVLAVPHSILNSILGRQPRKPWNWLISLRHVLMLPHPKCLRYIALGGSIYRALAEALPNATPHFRTLDPPYLWHHGSTLDDIGEVQVLRFGYLGVGTKGFDLFYRLASDVQGAKCEKPYELMMIGFLTGQGSDLISGQELVKGVSYTPLSREEYSQRASSVTYAVGTWRPEGYRLTASVSFLDAMSYVKPGIYLRNPYIEYYFGKMGDIGYLCDTYEEMRDVMISVLNEFPFARYRQQCENIRHGRRIFEPQVLAPQLRAIIRDSDMGISYQASDSAQHLSSPQAIASCSAPQRHRSDPG